MIKKKWMEKIFLLALVVLIAGCGEATTSTPEGAYEKFNDAVMSDDWDSVSDTLSKGSISRTEGLLKSLVTRTESYYRDRDEEDLDNKNTNSKVNTVMLLDPVDMKVLKPMMNLTGKEFFVKAAKETVKVRGNLKKGDYKLIDVKVREDKARLIVEHEGRVQETVMLRNEDGEWKVELNIASFIRPRNEQQSKVVEKAKERSK